MQYQELLLRLFITDAACRYLTRRRQRDTRAMITLFAFIIFHFLPFRLIFATLFR